MSIAPDTQLIREAWACKCPRCKTGNLFHPGFANVAVKDRCEECGLNLSKNDSADGPAVFLIFILGFLIVPLALWLDAAVTPPVWVHAIIWTIVSLGLTLGTLRPIKAYIIALQFKHRPGDWE